MAVYEHNVGSFHDYFQTHVTLSARMSITATHSHSLFSIVTFTNHSDFQKVNIYILEWIANF